MAQNCLRIVVSVLVEVEPWLICCFPDLCHAANHFKVCCIEFLQLLVVVAFDIAAAGRVCKLCDRKQLRLGWEGTMVSWNIFHAIKIFVWHVATLVPSSSLHLEHLDTHQFWMTFRPNLTFVIELLHSCVTIVDTSAGESSWVLKWVRATVCCQPA